MRILFLTIMIFICRVGYSQYQINSKVRSSSILIQHNYGSGSGFFLKDTLTQSIYAVTAAHVIVNLQTGKIYDSIGIIAYREDVDTDEKHYFLVDLAQSDSLLDLKIDQSNDVAVIRLARLILDSNYYRVEYRPSVNKLTKSSLINSWELYNSITLDKVVPGADLFIIGFPQSLGLKGNFDMDRPLIRKGIVAGRDMSLKRIIGDGAVYFGNSGGIAVSIVYDNGDFKMQLIGLVSQYIPFNDLLFDMRGVQRSIDYKNSGYSVIIPTDFITSLISQFK